MKKQFVIATLVALASATASFTAAAQTTTTDATTADATPTRHHVKRHPIRNRMHKIGRAIKGPHAPSAPAEPKP